MQQINIAALLLAYAVLCVTRNDIPYVRVPVVLSSKLLAKPTHRHMCVITTIPMSVICRIAGHTSFHFFFFFFFFLLRDREEILMANLLKHTGTHFDRYTS